MTRIGIIGYGAIGSWIADKIAKGAVPGSTLAAICARDRQIDAAASACPKGVSVCSAVDEFLSGDLDVVVEAAGQQVVRDLGPMALASGADFVILSTGALANEDLRKKLKELASRYQAKIKIPAGALAGFRGLMTMRQSEIDFVCYTSIKPPHAWEGTPAAQKFDLSGISEQTVIFQGNAADAAQQFPANANLAAAVALAGIGFERTQVKLIANPETDLNTGVIEAVGKAAAMTLTMAGKPFRQNPKTSLITAMSVISALQNEAETISFI